MTQNKFGEYAPTPCTIKTLRIRSKQVCLFAQSSVFPESKKTLAYYEICQFSTHESIMLVQALGPYSQDLI
jgi:hypothetical protein